MTNLDQEQEITRITSDIENPARYADISPANRTSHSHDDTLECRRGNFFTDQLNRYFDEVTLYLHNTTSILIFGTDKAKSTLHRNQVVHGHCDSTITVKTAYKMADYQIAAAVQQYFRKSQPELRMATQQKRSNKARFI